MPLSSSYSPSTTLNFAAAALVGASWYVYHIRRHSGEQSTSISWSEMNSRSSVYQETRMNTPWYSSSAFMYTEPVMVSPGRRGTGFVGSKVMTSSDPSQSANRTDRPGTRTSSGQSRSTVYGE